MTNAATRSTLIAHGDVVMLPLLLMLLSDPATPEAPRPTLDPEIRLRVIDGLNIPDCDAGGFQRVERSSGQAPALRLDLAYRPEDEVRQYLLLDRRVDGCPAPISYTLPGRQHGFIRELGRTAPTVRIQPPRSSE